MVIGGEQRRLWQALIDREVGRRLIAVGVVRNDFSLKNLAHGATLGETIDPFELYR